jgi:hypothetical protein
MTGSYLSAMDRRLRQILAADPDQGGIGRFAVVILVSGLFYGGVMGTYAGASSIRLLQIFYSASKVPPLLMVTFVLALPSFFVLNTLLGLRADFGRVLRALVTTQATVALVLAAMAPYTALWYASSADYPSAQLFNLLVFALASATGQIVLRRGYRSLIAADRRHYRMMRLWLGIYGFIGVQMGWVLRPFVGKPESAVQFFRPDSWTNAYVSVAQLFWKILGG